MSNINHMKEPIADIPTGLRNIADSVESGEFKGECTVVIGTELFHLGTPSDKQALKEALLNLQYGIQKLMTFYGQVATEEQG